MLRRLTVLAFAFVTLGGVFAAHAGATTGGGISLPFPSGVVLSGNAIHGPAHKVWTQNLSPAACEAVREVSPKARCSVTVTIDVRITDGPQKPPAGAQVAPAVKSSSYWSYMTGTMTSSGPLYHATLQEEVSYHDNCPNANCNPQGVIWNQWIDTSGFSCDFGCDIQNIQDGVINNGHDYLNGWENYEVDCNLSITGNSAGCNSGHGNRLYFRADGYWYGYSY